MFAFLELANKHKTPYARVFSAVGIDENTLFRWSRRPPPPEAINTCSDKLRLLRIRMNTTNITVASGGGQVGGSTTVTENESPNGFPKAIAFSPSFTLSESPKLNSG